LRGSLEGGSGSIRCPLPSRCACSPLLYLPELRQTGADPACWHRHSESEVADDSQHPSEPALLPGDSWNPSRFYSNPSPSPSLHDHSERGDAVLDMTFLHAIEVSMDQGDNAKVRSPPSRGPDRGADGCSDGAGRLLSQWEPL